VTRSPFLETSHTSRRLRRRVEAARRRRRRRRAGASVLLLAAAAGLFFVRGLGDSPQASHPRRHAPTPLAHAPAAPAPATRPLTLRLERVPDPVILRFHHPPRAGLLFDLDTGRVFWRRDPTEALPIASLTKMMTALIVVSKLPPDAKVRITKEALAYKGSGVGVLPKGKRVKLETLLNGLLLPSGNDAAIALAQRASGTVANFVRSMNERAAELGLSCTRYSSPDGFEDAGNYSCAEDLAALARADLDQRRIARIVRRRRAVLPFPIKGGRIFLFNNNPLIRLGYPGITGLKTGYTVKAGRCLVATATRRGIRLGVVLLHSPDPAVQARKLLDRGFRLTRTGAA
jgi:serine-type D-Ala-D-Ala carboxypeptidase (penicillin-binding protein 5/6)